MNHTKSSELTRSLIIIFFIIILVLFSSNNVSINKIDKLKEDNMLLQEEINKLTIVKEEESEKLEDTIKIELPIYKINFLDACNNYILDYENGTIHKNTINDLKDSYYYNHSSLLNKTMITKNRRTFYNYCINRIEEGLFYNVSCYNGCKTIRSIPGLCSGLDFINNTVCIDTIIQAYQFINPTKEINKTDIIQTWVEIDTGSNREILYEDYGLKLFAVGKCNEYILNK